MSRRPPPLQKPPPRPDRLWVPTNGQSNKAPNKDPNGGRTYQDQSAPLVTRETSEHPWDPRTPDDAKVNTRRAQQLRHIAIEKRAEGKGDEANAYEKQATALDECGKYAWCCTTQETGQPKLAVNHCRSRLCPHCQRQRALDICHRIYPTIQAMPDHRFVTLTMKHDNRPLWLQVKSLQVAWKLLRRTKWWKATCTGGFYTIEVSINKQTRQWHPHIHAICEGNYIDNERLAEEWHKITGNSFIVDVRNIDNDAAAVRELAKYINKPGQPLKLTLPELEEYIDALKDLRLVQGWGTAHNRPPDPDPPPPREALNRIVPIHQLLIAADAGDTGAAELYRHWLRLGRGNPHDTPANLTTLTEAWYRRRLYELQNPSKKGKHRCNSP